MSTVAELPGQRERIDAYLERSGLAPKRPRVVPLTGDASDRRYYRVLVADAPSIVLFVRACVDVVPTTAAPPVRPWTSAAASMWSCGSWRSRPVAACSTRAPAEWETAIVLSYPRTTVAVLVTRSVTVTTSSPAAP